MSQPQPVGADAPAIASALRTLEVERDGLDTLRNAIAGPLGPAFAGAVALASAA
jgi:arabinose-5-phosphate isomerase